MLTTELSQEAIKSSQSPRVNYALHLIQPPHRQRRRQDLNMTHKEKEKELSLSPFHPPPSHICPYSHTKYREAKHQNPGLKISKVAINKPVSPDPCDTQRQCPSSHEQSHGKREVGCVPEQALGSSAGITLLYSHPHQCTPQEKLL